MTIEKGKVVIHAVHNRDVEAFWKKLGLKEVEKCFICGKDVTPKNVGAFAPIKGEPKVICGELYCYSRFKEHRRKQLPKP